MSGDEVRTNRLAGLLQDSRAPAGNMLGGLFGYGNVLKRKLGGLLADPMGTLALGATRFAEDQQASNNLMRNAYPMAGDRTVLNAPDQRGLLQSQFAGEAANMGMGALGAATVWHGSPHKFDKFDSSRIGTGEGAQAYGHGLYLADRPDVAKQYQKLAFSKKPDLGNIPKPMSHADYLEFNDLNFAFKDKKPLNEIQLARLQELSNKKSVYDNAIKEAVPQPNLYKVDLPDEHIAKMLDWDKPLSQQAPGVQALFDDIKRLQDPYIRSKTSTGEAMGELAGLLGGRAQASEHLRSKGIPGIRYLDGGSRAGGAGTSNYVVFPGNENLLKILQRNGQDLP